MFVWIKSDKNLKRGIKNVWRERIKVVFGMYGLNDWVKKEWNEMDCDGNHSI